MPLPEGYTLHRLETVDSTNAEALRRAEAGADALELNIYKIAADTAMSSGEVEQSYLDLVEKVRESVDLPIAVKIGPWFSSVGHMARRLVDAGADGIVMFNRFYEPDFDLEALDVDHRLDLSTPAEMRLALHWTALLSGRVDASLGATTGVHDAEGVLKLVLAGADATMMASALLTHGSDHVGVVLDGVREWLTERGYDSGEQAKGSLSQQHSPDPAAFERLNYLRTLVHYSSSRH